jgi:hypothetical protein
MTESHARDWGVPRVSGKEPRSDEKGPNVTLSSAKRGSLSPTRGTERVARGSMGVAPGTRRSHAWLFLLGCLNRKRGLNRRSALRAQPGGKVVMQRHAKPSMPVRSTESLKHLYLLLSARRFAGGHQMMLAHPVQPVTQLFGGEALLLGVPVLADFPDDPVIAG